MKIGFAAVILMAAMMVISNNTFAQSSEYSNKENSSYKNSGTPEQMATKRTDKLSSKLNLTSSQYSSVYSYILSSYQQMQSIKNSNYSKQEMHDQMMKIHESTQVSIRGVLTSDQIAIFDKMKNDRKDGQKYEGQKKDKGNKKHKKSKDKRENENEKD